MCADTFVFYKKKTLFASSSLNIEGIPYCQTKCMGGDRAHGNIAVPIERVTKVANINKSTMHK